ncbi:tetraspanin-8-like [Cheilinus undulatus]|uniref:tetraspanin-8-like n=1 Tax=Cheilinus undulatus TaxID=241271 RepID=UPI001BD20D39|nr:tetraspanin-8-like [Cheilinus undulatus]
MGRVNVWLKRSYIIVTSLIAIISTLLLAFTLFSHGYLHKDEEIEQMITGLHGMYAISIIPLLLCILGLFGACKQKMWPLIVFAVAMILGILFLIVCEINGLAVKPQMAAELTKYYQAYLPLFEADDVVIAAIQEIQTEFQCCGLEKGYIEWGKNISKSCLCAEGATNPCVAAPINGDFLERTGVQPVMIYQEPCIPQLISHHMAVMNAVLGILVGIILLLLLSVVLCIMILCRLNRKDNTPTVVYSPEAKAGNYVTLTDAADCT